MEKGDLDTLFSAIMDDPEAFPEGARKVLNILIRVTLEYRDQMLASGGIVVTVHDVRTSLSWLVPSLATGNVPKMENSVSRELLVQWLNVFYSLPNP